MNRYCKKCEHQVVLHAFSFGNCELCGTEVSTGHIPVNRICDKCAEENDLCESCGNKIEKEE